MGTSLRLVGDYLIYALSPGISRRARGSAGGGASSRYVQMEGKLRDPHFLAYSATSIAASASLCPPSKGICAAASFSPAPACQSMFRDDAKDAEMGLSYVGHDEGQCSHTLVLRLGRQDPTNRPSCNATVSTSVTIPAEFGPAARGPRLFSLLPCRLVCPCGVLHFPLLPRRCSSPLTPPSPHLLQDMCRVVSRGEGGILVVWWYPPHLVGGAAANPGAASTLN